MDRERANRVLKELNRKLLLLRAEKKSLKRMEIVDSIFEERKGLPLDEQGEEKQLKVLLGLDKE